MLFDPARHEPLLAADWNATRVRENIAAIVADLEASLGAGSVWPDHPLDDVDACSSGQKTLYLGAAGVLWAMWYLARQGAVELRIAPSALIASIYRSYLAEPDTGEVVPSYFLGEVGLLLVHWRLLELSEAAERLRTAIERNIGNPTNEPLWGAPGTMIGAWHMLAWTGGSRWRDLFLDNAEQLWRTWLFNEDLRCHLWTQDLYGHVGHYLGAAHGFAGNVYVLLRSAALLSAERRELLYDRCAATVRATAVLDADGANWPATVELPRSGRPSMLVQWCHGAPGMVTALADFPSGRSSDMDALLIKAGTTVWEAGPPTKGHGLCHGTAGNGYAFLTLYRRTGDPLWLARARAFAMHAIGQRERMGQQYGRGRYTLWTGDPGLAVYLWHCLVGTGGVPGLDTLV